MITNDTRVQSVDGLTGTVIGEPEDTFAGPTVTVEFDDVSAAGTPSGRVDVRVADLTELVDDTARPVGEAHGEPLSYGQLMDICDDLETEDHEHRVDCRCQCGAVREDTDPLMPWQHDRQCECDCGSPTREQSVDAS